MAAKSAPPRPNKNADGQQKQPAQNPTGGPSAAPPPGPGQAPSLVPPGGPAPMEMIQNRINFKDLPPMDQAQLEEKQGINPAAPLQMMQQQLGSSMQTPDQGPVPANAIGPMMPPGIENFPHDMSALMQVMQRGYAPGATNAEHAMAQNAHSMARASEAHAQNQASQQVHAQGLAQLINSLMQQLAMHASPQPGQPAPPGQAPPGAPPQLGSSY